AQTELLPLLRVAAVDPPPERSIRLRDLDDRLLLPEERWWPFVEQGRTASAPVPNYRGRRSTASARSGDALRAPAPLAASRPAERRGGPVRRDHDEDHRAVANTLHCGDGRH